MVAAGPPPRPFSRAARTAEASPAKLRSSRSKSLSMKGLSAPRVEDAGRVDAAESRIESP